MSTFVAVFVGRTHEQMLNSISNCDLDKGNKSRFITIKVCAMCVGFCI